MMYKGLLSTMLALSVISVATVGCKGGKVREDPILRLSAEESLVRGKELMEAGKYAQARKYLSHAFEIEPNSRGGREALLLVADALFHQRGPDHLIQAEAKYRDYLNRFPTSDRTAYVQYQIGNALFERLEKPDRDQEMTHKALEAYDELLRLYPGSDYEEEARAKIVDLNHRLAEHEFVVAYFYWRYGLPQATAQRLEHLVESFPDYPELDKVYLYLGLAQSRIGQKEDAEQWFRRLREEFPDSDLISEIPAEG